MALYSEGNPAFAGESFMWQFQLPRHQNQAWFDESIIHLYNTDRSQHGFQRGNFTNRSSRF
jgi:hypothetical protein